MTGQGKQIKVEDWGRMDHQTAQRRQADLVLRRAEGLEPDRLVLVEHPPTVTIGKSGGPADLCLDRSVLSAKGIAVAATDRGGMATYHAPGQLVAYPIIELTHRDLHRYVAELLEAAAALLRRHGLEPGRDPGQPGLWVNGAKIASLGVAAKRWVVSHGIAINVNNDLDGFGCIVPCGRPGQAVTSMARELGAPLNMAQIKARFIEEFCRVLGYERLRAAPAAKPAWLKRPHHDAAVIADMERRLSRLKLATVCQSAQCPNLGECFNRGTATFMILGERCTRNCRFCAVPHGPLGPPDPDEPLHVAQASAELGLEHVVVTSVTRDDMPDGGAEHFARTIAELRRLCPGTSVEVLIPDLKGDESALAVVCRARPEVFNHNVETVPRLYRAVRPQADYRRSLAVLNFAARQGLIAKSGLMLGLGEEDDEIAAVLQDLLDAGCDHLTLGQYLAPSAEHAPVARYVSPEEFDAWAAKAREMGFAEVAAGPLVRSSYLADRMYRHGGGSPCRRAEQPAAPEHHRTPEC